MTYRHLLFDFDHTLFDTNRSERLAFETLMNEVGVVDIDGAFVLYQPINRRLWRAAERGEILPAAIGVRRFTEFNQQVGLDADPIVMASTFVRLLGAHGDWFPGVELLLAELSRRARLAIVTNAVSEVQRARLARLPGAELFGAVVISTEVGAVKPSSAIFEAVLDVLERPPLADVLMVGDSLSSDIAGGAAFGVDTCWFNPQRVVLTGSVVPTHTIAHLDELMMLVTE